MSTAGRHTHLAVMQVWGGPYRTRPRVRPGPTRRSAPTRRR